MVADWQKYSNGAPWGMFMLTSLAEKYSIDKKVNHDIFIYSLRMFDL